MSRHTFSTYLNDAKCVAFDCLDRKTSGSRVSSLGSARSAKQPDLWLSCALVRIERLFYIGTLSFAVKNEKQTTKLRFMAFNLGPRGNTATYLIVQEDEIHLNENKRHSGGGC